MAAEQKLETLLKSWRFQRSSRVGNAKGGFATKCEGNHVVYCTVESIHVSREYSSCPRREQLKARTFMLAQHWFGGSSFKRRRILRASLRV